MADLEKMVDELSKLTVLEASDLSKMLEEKWGVSASAPVAVAAVSVQNEEGDSVVEKDSFNVVLEVVGDKKINVIKEVRSLTGLGLKEAKGLVDGAPNTLKEDVATGEANEWKEKLEAAGATVTLK